VTACQTAPKTQPVLGREGEWTASAVIEEKRNEVRHFLNLQIVARQPEQMRMDATAAMGVYVGSFVMNGPQTDFLSARDKKFYTGPTGPEMMQALLRTPLDPRTFHKVLFGEALDKEEWSCSTIQSQYVCDHRHTDLKLSIKDQSPSERLLSLNSPMVSARFKVRLVESTGGQGEELFRLQSPEGFRVYRLK
jgi:hypothetical protein